MLIRTKQTTQTEQGYSGSQNREGPVLLAAAVLPATSSPPQESVGRIEIENSRARRERSTNRLPGPPQESLAAQDKGWFGKSARHITTKRMQILREGGTLYRLGMGGLDRNIGLD